MIALEVPVSDRCLYDDDEYYRPCKVLALVRLYHVLNDSKPPVDDELRGLALAVFGPGGWREESMAKRTDLDNALGKLMTVDTELASAVLGELDGDRQADTARSLGISISTLRKRRDEGVWLMASYLGWDQGCCRDPYMKCPRQGEGILEWLA